MYPLSAMIYLMVMLLPAAVPSSLSQTELQQLGAVLGLGPQETQVHFVEDVCKIVIDDILFLGGGEANSRGEGGAEDHGDVQD